MPTETAVPTTTLDAPPGVTVRLSDDRVDKGAKITIAVAGTDDRGLDWISWKGLDDIEDPELDREHRADCHDRPRCAEIWTVAVTQPGTFRLLATARDTEGRRSTASVELRVRDTAPATRTPAPTATRTR